MELLLQMMEKNNIEQNTLLQLEDFIPKGIFSLIYKRLPLSVDEFLEYCNGFLDEQDFSFLNKKIKQIFSIEFDTKNTDVSLFNSVEDTKNSNKSDSSEIAINEKVVVNKTDNNNATIQQNIPLKRIQVENKQQIQYLQNRTKYVERER